MRITDIQQQQKNQHYYSIFVDDSYEFSLTQADIHDQSLRIGLEIEAGELRRLKQLSDDSKLYERALSKALRRPHSVKEIRDYLRQKEAGDTIADSIIGKLTEKGYLNDVDFTHSWYAMRSKAGKSRRYINSELKQKGVHESVIQEVATEYDDASAIRRVLDKKAHRYSDTNQLIQYLQRQGFSYYDVTKELEESSFQVD